MNISLLTHHKNNTDKLYCSQKVCIVCVSVATPCVLFSAKRGCTVTELIFFIIPHLNYVALVCTGMCMWVLEARREFLGRRQTEEEEGGRCAHLILLSSGAAAFSFLCVFSFFSFFFFCLPLCCCTCLLFILRSEKEESGWWEKATFSPLWGCSCILPNCLMKGTFVLQWNISPFTSSWCGLPSFFFSFSFLGKRLIFRPDSRLFYSFKVDGKLERICVCVQSLLNGRSGPRGSKYNFWFIECLFYAAQDSARGGCKL